MKITLAFVVVAGLVLVAGLAIDARSTLAAYLVAWVAIGAIPLGVLGVLMTSYLVRRAWTDALHGIMVSATSVLPVLGVLLLPVLIGIKGLYPAAEPGHALPAFKAFYLAPWFFVLRTVVYFVVLCGLALWQPAVWGDPERMMRSASVGLIVWALWCRSPASTGSSRSNPNFTLQSTACSISASHCSTAPPLLS